MPKHTNATLPKSVRLYDTLFLVIADTYCFGWSGESSLPDPLLSYHASTGVGIPINSNATLLVASCLPSYSMS